MSVEDVKEFSDEELLRRFWMGSSAGDNPQKRRTVGKKSIKFLSFGDDYIDPEYMDNIQSELTPSNRTILFEWLLTLSKHLKLHDESLATCLRIIDRYWSVEDIKWSACSLLGMSALVIAGKYHEFKPPAFETLLMAYDDDNILEENMVEMEKNILETLGCNISRPNARSMACRLLRILSSHMDPKNYKMLCETVFYILERLVMCYDLIWYNIFEHASAAICLALNIMGMPKSHRLLEALPDYFADNFKKSELNILGLVKKLRHILSPLSEQKDLKENELEGHLAVIKKFSTEGHLFVYQFVSKQKSVRNRTA